MSKKLTYLARAVFRRGILPLAITLSILLLPVSLFGGGSGLNTVVVLNQSSSNSVQLANYYCEKRQIPPDNVSRISWGGGNVSWTDAEMQTALVQPLLNLLSARQLSNQIDYVVLSMDIPYQTLQAGSYNGTTTTLFYGSKPDGGTNWLSLTNGYAFSEGVFHDNRPSSAPRYSFLTMMLTGDSLAHAKSMIDQGVSADGSYPFQPALLARSSDAARNIRFAGFDNAIFNCGIRGLYSAVQTNMDSPYALSQLLGLQTGLNNFSISPNTFVPGALADSMSSYAGLLFSENSGTTLLAMINAGACASYGTVTEPGSDADKFPDPQAYFYQSRGFTAAECYYQSINVPYLGLLVGEPLSAPFARQGAGAWTLKGQLGLLSGQTNLAAQFSAYDSEHPLNRVDLFIDGRFSQTLTNISPRTGDQLTAAINGYPILYTVPPIATLGSVALGLAAQFNAQSNITKVVALAKGDRIELHSVTTNRVGEPVFFADSAGGQGTHFYRAVPLPGTIAPALSSGGRDVNGVYRMHVVSPVHSSWNIEASTDLTHWVPICNNPAGGPFDFWDPASQVLPFRFYRIAEPVPNQTMRLTLAGTLPGNVNLHVDAANLFPYEIETSSNLKDWSSYLTNQSGGILDLAISAGPVVASRFFRGHALPEAASSIPQITDFKPGLLQATGAGTQPYRLEVSTDLNNWTAVGTNLSPGATVLTTGTAGAGGLAPTVLLNAARAHFIESPAQGYKTFTVSGILQASTWMQLLVTKTNGITVGVGVTNAGFAQTLMEMGQLLTNAINSSPLLQGSDGVTAEDLSPNQYGGPLFTLRARGHGLDAARLQARLLGSSRLALNPNTNATLTLNQTDLHPRAHLYVAGGATNLSAGLVLDTRQLAEGAHELTAVAYEGTSVQTQTKATAMIVISNSPLAATLTRLDLPAMALAQGTYHIRLDVNTNQVAAIHLLSTGGELAQATNVSSATFPINGTYLGAGLHAFYALVEMNDGRRYQTAKQWVRLVNTF